MEIHLLESAHDTKGKGRGLIHQIANKNLRKHIEECVDLIDKTRLDHRLKMPLNELGEMVNKFLCCVVSVRDYCRHLSTSSGVDLVEERNYLPKQVQNTRHDTQNVLTHARFVGSRTTQKEGEWVAVALYGTIGAPVKGSEHEAIGLGINHI